MTEALIIDACRTPRGIGKAGKGALSDMHPQQLGAAVLRALAERTGINTGDIDDIIWGTSAQVGPQCGDMGRMSALDAGYDIRASGVTLDRFCGSGITTVNMAAASIMSGQEDLVIAGGTEKMSMQIRRGDGPMMMDFGNLRLRARHPQSHQGVCADAVATLEGISREDTDKLALMSQQRAANAIKNGHFDKSLVPVHREDGSLALDKEEYPRPQTTLEGLAALKPAFPAIADFALDEKGTTYRKLILDKYPDLEINHIHHAGNSSGVVDGSGALLLASPAYAKSHGLKPRAPRGGDGQHGRLADADAERTGARRAQSAGEGRPHRGRHRPLGDQRGVRRGGGEIHPRPEARPRQGQRQRRLDRARPPDRRHRLDPDRHPARRTRAPQPQARPRHHVRRRRHGAGDHHRAGVGVIARTADPHPRAVAAANSELVAS